MIRANRHLLVAVLDRPFQSGPGLREPIPVSPQEANSRATPASRPAGRRGESPESMFPPSDGDEKRWERANPLARRRSAVADRLVQGPTSPPFGVTAALQAGIETPVRTIRTLPSPISAWTPPAWIG